MGRGSQEGGSELGVALTGASGLQEIHVYTVYMCTLALMARTGQSHFYYFLSNILSWFWLPRVCNRTGALPDYKHFLTATKLDELVLLFYPH